MEIKSIALVAHDSRKEELIEWATYNKEKLSQYQLLATGTTGKMLSNIVVSEQQKFDRILEETVTVCDKLDVQCLLSGPLGGDQQIGSMIATGKVDMLIFFCDNLIMQGHQNDVSALTRLASLYNIPFATNRTTADLILTSPLLDKENKYEVKKPNFSNYINRYERK